MTCVINKNLKDRWFDAIRYHSIHLIMEMLIKNRELVHCKDKYYGKAIHIISDGYTFSDYYDCHWEDNSWDYDIFDFHMNFHRNEYSYERKSPKKNDQKISKENKNLIEVLETLLEYGSPVNEICYKRNLSPLMISIQGENKYEVAKKLLEYGADPNQVNSDGDTPLILAIQKDNCDVVELLLEYGADMRQLNNKRKPLTQIYHYNMIVFLVENGLKMDNFHIDVPSFMHGKDKKFDKLNFLLSSGAKVDMGDRRWNKLWFNSHYEIDIMKKMLELGFDINKLDSDGNSLLMICYSRSKSISMNILIENGADIFYINQDNIGLIHMALFNNDIEFVDRLLKMGCNFGLDKQGYSRFIRRGYRNINQETHNYFQDYEGYREYRMINEE